MNDQFGDEATNPDIAALTGAAPPRKEPPAAIGLLEALYVDLGSAGQYTFAGRLREGLDSLVSSLAEAGILLPSAAAPANVAEGEPPPPIFADVAEETGISPPLKVEEEA